MRSRKHLEPAEDHRYLSHDPELGYLHLTLSERHQVLSVSGTLKPSSRFVAVAGKQSGTRALSKSLNPNMEMGGHSAMVPRASVAV